MKTKPNPRRRALPSSSIPPGFPIRRLSAEEIANPRLVFDRLFTNTHPPALRRALWHWFKLTVTGIYHLETALSKEQLVYLYEEVERVLEAVWVMRGRSQ